MFSCCRAGQAQAQAHEDARANAEAEADRGLRRVSASPCVCVILVVWQVYLLERLAAQDLVTAKLLLHAVDSTLRTLTKPLCSTSAR